MRKVQKSSYEELRRQRLEENLKRLEELNLPKLAQKLKDASPKPSPAKPKKPRIFRKEELEYVDVRRSPRVAGKPTPDYKDVSADEKGRTPIRSYKRRDLAGRVYASDEARSFATNSANEIHSKLRNKFPSFVKSMLQSHVTGGFWLGLPNQFCKSHLPRSDEMVTLIDEKGDEYPTVYLAQKTGLSGGWRGFSLDHSLVDGDALVFELVKPTTFKIYIVRASDYRP
ncbi:B3 domain-containing protein At3g19184 isoform X2 [Aristolochia californica]|uniref:B3 domain-containing protein At3g19184 isoform X2 n=1 Tax=Aristolochia californica TaxID=171875 RepID=UPI0035D53522